MKDLKITLCCALCLPLLSHAAEPPKWTGEAEVGYVDTRGNSQTSTLSAKSKIARESGKWLQTGRAEALKTEDHDQTNAERYLLGAKTTYRYAEHRYSFINLNYEADRFSGYNYRASGAIGYGYRFLNSDTMQLDVEAGPGARQSELDNGVIDRELIGFLSANYNWKINNGASFAEELSTEASEETSISKSVTSLKSQVAENLAMKLTYTVKYTSVVPAGIAQADRETAMTLVLSF